MWRNKTTAFNLHNNEQILQLAIGIALFSHLIQQHTVFIYFIIC